MQKPPIRLRQLADAQITGGCLILEPPPGLEPGTFALQKRCSAVELGRHIDNRGDFYAEFFSLMPLTLRKILKRRFSIRRSQILKAFKTFSIAINVFSRRC